MSHLKISILIPSCDNYADIWPLLAESYDRFWQDCPYEKYIITNGKVKTPSIFREVNVGEDLGWCANLITALKRIDTEYVLMHIDDLILTSKPDQKNIDIYTEEFLKQGGNYIKLLNVSRSTKNTSIIETMIEAPYRTSTVFSIWKKEVLLDLLNPTENAWQLEIVGTNRSKKYNGWYSAPTDCFTYANLVIKRVIERRSLSRIENLGIHYVGDRKKMGKKENLKYILKCWIFEIILRLPTGFSKKMVELARKIG